MALASLEIMYMQRLTRRGATVLRCFLHATGVLLWNASIIIIVAPIITRPGLGSM